MRTRRDFAAFTAGALASKLVLPLAAKANETGAPDGAPTPDAELIAMGQRAAQLAAEYAPLIVRWWAIEKGGPDFRKQLAEVTAGMEPLSDEMYDLAERAADIPTTTLPGMIAKARIAHHHFWRDHDTEDGLNLNPEEEVTWSLLNDLVALGGAA